MPGPCLRPERTIWGGASRMDWKSGWSAACLCLLARRRLVVKNGLRADDVLGDGFGGCWAAGRGSDGVRGAGRRRRSNAIRQLILLLLGGSERRPPGALSSV